MSRLYRQALLPSCLQRIRTHALYAVLQVDEHDVPVTKLFIRDAEVLWNPFDDLQPRVDKEDKKAALEAEAARQKQRSVCTAVPPAVTCSLSHALDYMPRHVQGKHT